MFGREGSWGVFGGWFNSRVFYALLTASVVILILFIIFTVRTLSHRQIALSREIIKRQAVELFDTIEVMRLWSTYHGGVFVKKTPGLEPNPYLKKGSMRSATGETYILINPAWMTREVLEMARTRHGNKHYFHISSLDPVNPANTPDPFERRSLEYLAEHPEEKYVFEFPDDNPGLMYFYGALRAETACAGCHTGVKPGDLRGGIRMSIPIDIFRAKEEFIHKTENKINLAVFLLSVIAGILSFLLFRYLKLRQLAVERDNLLLESRVRERTSEIHALYDQEKYLRSIMETITRVNSHIVSSTTPADLLGSSLKTLATHDHYRYCWIALREGEKLVVAEDAGDHSGVGKLPSLSLVDSSDRRVHPAITSYLEGRTLEVHASEDQIMRSPEKVPEELRHSGLHSLISVPLRAGSGAGPFGVLVVCSDRKNGFEAEESGMLEELSGDIGFAYDALRKQTDLNQLKTERLSNYEETILSFVHLIEQRDSYTAGHSLRVARYGAMIADQLEVEKEEKILLERAAILHDIGKIATPDSILLRPGQLSPLEFDLIKMHVDSGYHVLSRIHMYRELAEIIRNHHEWYNGRGYPQGVSGEKIPYLARILTVADAFDAMTTDRIYHDKYNVKQAIAELQRCSGTQFDPGVVEAALVAFEEVTLEEPHFQLPETELEKKRFAYFFNDPLTDLYNEEYLKVLLQEKHKVELYSRIIFFSLKRFSDYNKREGWDRGDALLIALARFFSKEFPRSLCFRAHGDIFVVITDRSAAQCNHTLQEVDLLKRSEIEFWYELIEISGKVEPEAKRFKTLSDFLH